MKARLTSFLEELRNSDEGRKRRWAAGFSAVSMVLVFMIWFATLQTAVRPFDSATREPSKRASAFLETFKAGSVILWDRISASLRREREVMIERKEFTFIPKDAPAIPVSELPLEQDSK